MPELPEVETVCRGLSEKLIGKTIRDIQILSPVILDTPPKKFVQRTTGQQIKAVQRHGKRIFLNLSNQILTIHLRMTGQLIFSRDDTAPGKHTHLIFNFADMKEALFYRDIRKFGRIGLVERIPETPPDAWLGRNEELIQALLAKRGMIKHTLLSQNVIAGLGNIYVDECLYKAKIHPRKLIQKLKKEKIQTLCASIRAILSKAIQAGGTTFSNYVDTRGKRGGFKGFLCVYGKEGSFCSCGAKIKRIVVASRGTHYCPRCQR